MAANPLKPMDRAMVNEINKCDMSELHAKVRQKLFPDKAISQSENRETCRKSISLLDTSVLDTTNAEKLIQFMRMKRGYNNRPRLLLNSSSPEKAKRVWPIEIETLIEDSSDKQKENTPNTTSKNKSDAEGHSSTPKFHLTNDFQPVVPLRRMSKRLAAQSSVNEISNNTRKDQSSFHPVIASTPNHGKTGVGDLISNTSIISSNASSCGTIPDSVKESRILNEADTNHKPNTNISKANKPTLNKTQNAPKNPISVQDNVSENNDNNIEELNAQEQNLHSNQKDNCSDDDDDDDHDEQTLTNRSKTLINNENINSKNKKTRSGVTSLERHLRVELKKVKAANVSLRKELIQRKLSLQRDLIATSARKTNEFKKISISSPADNNKSSTKSNNTIHREISTTAVNYNKETIQQFETDEDIHRVNKTVNEFRKDYGQAPFIVIPIHQSFHSPKVSEKNINTTEHKETEVLERSQKQQPPKKKPNKNDKSRKSSSKNTLNTSSTSSDYVRLPSLDDLLTDDEDTPRTPSQPLDLRLNLCKPLEHTETNTISKITTRSSIKNLNPSDILVDDIIYYSQKQRNDKQLHTTKSPMRRTQTRLNEHQEFDINTSLSVPSPALENVDIDESGSERIVDCHSRKEPDWHKTLYQSAKNSDEKSVVAKRPSRAKKSKVSRTIVTPYLELSKTVNKKKRRTQSFVKRKLYSKGRSDEELSSFESNPFDREKMLSGSSTNTLKNEEMKQNESKQKSEKITKVVSKRKSSYAERKDETEARPKVTQEDNDDDIFVKPSKPVTRSKHNKKTTNTTTRDDDHPSGSQSAEQTVSDIRKEEQAKKKKILKQSKNIKRKNSSNAANVTNNIEIPLEPISVEPELQDWLGNDISTSDNFVDNNKKQKHRRRDASKSKLKENNDRADLVNHNTNIDSDNSGRNTITKQTLIEKKSANHNDEYAAEQREKRQNNAKNTNKSKAQSNKIKARKERTNYNKNQELDALLLEDDSTQNGLRRSKRTHRPPIQYWTNTGGVQKNIDLNDKEVKKLLLKPKKQRVKQKQKNIPSQQQLGTEKKQNDDGDKTVCDLFDQLKENLEETLRKRKESPSINEKTNKKRLKLTANNEKDTDIRKLSCEIMPPPPAPPPQRKRAIKPAQDNSTLNSTDKSLGSYIQSNNANAAASSDDGIGTADENIGMSTLAAEGVDTVHNSQKRQEKDGTKDFLLDWLVNNSPSYLQQNRDVFKLLSSDKIKIACIENLVINELNGVEYANYTGKDNNYGYMKFYPNSQKPRSKSKNKEMKMLILVGNLTISLDEKRFNVKNGDFVTIPQGTRYVINNNTDQCSILFFIKL